MKVVEYLHYLTLSGEQRGMVIQTFYDLRRPGAQRRLKEWEDGWHGPIIT
jgi:hypothetical protein